MRITSKGQVTIPIEIRKKAGLLPHTEVEFVFDGEMVMLRKSEVRQDRSRGRKLVERLRGAGDVNLGMSTDELMDMLRGE